MAPPPGGQSSKSRSMGAGELLKTLFAALVVATGVGFFVYAIVRETTETNGHGHASERHVAAPLMSHPQPPTLSAAAAAPRRHNRLNRARPKPVVAAAPGEEVSVDSPAFATLKRCSDALGAPLKYRLVPVPGLVKGLVCTKESKEECHEYLTGRGTKLEYIRDLEHHIIKSLAGAGNEAAKRVTLFDVGSTIGWFAAWAMFLGDNIAAVHSVERRAHLLGALKTARCINEISDKKWLIHAASDTLDLTGSGASIVHIGNGDDAHVKTALDIVAKRQQKPVALIVQHRSLIADIAALAAPLFERGYIGYSYISRTYATNVEELAFFASIDDLERRPTGFAQALVFILADSAELLTDAPSQPYIVPLAPTLLKKCMRPDLPQTPLAGYRLNPNYRAACTMDADAVCSCIRKDGAWEEFIFRVVEFGAQVLRERGVTPMYIDIGGNVGAMVIKMAGQGTVSHAFEMLPKNMQMLATSKCLNNLENLSLHHYGLGDAPVKCKMITGPGSNDGLVDCSGRTPEQIKPYLIQGEVDIKMLDDVLESTGIAAALDAGRVPVAKIDVEGFELRVMRGASKLLSHKNRPMLIVSEVWKSLDLVSYGKLMQTYGYVAFGFWQNKWLTTEEDFKRFTDEMQNNLDTVAFMEPQFARNSFHLSLGQHMRINKFSS